MSAKQLPENNPLYHIIGWLAYFLFTTFIIISSFPLFNTLIRQITFLITDMMMYYFIFYFLFPRYYEQRKYWQHFTIGGVAFMALFLIRGIVVTNFVFIDQIRAGNIKELPVFMQGGLTLLTIVSIATGIKMFLLAYRYQERQAALEKEKLTAEMNFLKAQVNPHFLFNALNNIYGLSVIGSQKASEMIWTLSEFLRHNIYKSTSEKVKLVDEVKYLEHYVQLYKMKYNESLDIRFDHSQIDDQLEIEPLLLINFFENAFKHSGISPEGGFVHATLRTEHNILSFYIENSLPGFEMRKDRVGGIGLDNIQKRLALSYHDKHELHIQQSETTFIVKLELYGN